MVIVKRVAVSGDDAATLASLTTQRMKRATAASTTSATSSTSLPLTATRRKLFRRVDACAHFRRWLFECGEALQIVGPPQCGKTIFARQLAKQQACVGAHLCLDDWPQTTETATVLRSLGAQLVRHFPNLVLPRLATTTLLADVASSDALDHYLRLPLGALPRPARPMFLVIDNVTRHVVPLVDQIRQCLPTWIRLVITRQVPIGWGVDGQDEDDDDVEALFFSAFHTMRLHVDAAGDFDRFAKSRLPQFAAADVVNAAEHSWFYVDQLARASRKGLVAEDALPATMADLLDEIVAEMAARRVVALLRLIVASRHPPSRTEVLAAGQLVRCVDDDTGELTSPSERDLAAVLDTVEGVFDMNVVDGGGDGGDYDDVVPTPTLRVPPPWREQFVDGADLGAYHAAWAEHFKTKRRKSPQDVVELAYHFAHSKADMATCVRTLRSVGAPNLRLQCAVVDSETTRLLVTAGALIDPDIDLVYACALGESQTVSRLVAGKAVSPLDACFGLLTAASRGNVGVCNALLDAHPSAASLACAVGDWNALRAAACNGHLDVLRLLLAKGIAVDECGTTSTGGRRTALRAAAWAGQLDAVVLLLQAGADVAHRDRENRTALMAAAFMDHADVVDALLDFSPSSVDAVDASGATALHLHLSNGNSDEEHQRTTTQLLRHGASCNVADVNGRVALHLVAYHDDPSLELILANSATVDVMDSMGQTPLILAAGQGKVRAVQFLVECGGADVDGIDAHGRTALQLAAINGHAHMVAYLVELGSDEAHKDNDGAMALHYAVAHDDAELVRQLANDVTVAAADSFGGQHPLIVACQHGHVATVAELVRHSAPVNRPTLDARTAVSTAALAGHVDVVELLAPYVSDWTQADQDGTPLLHTLLINKQTYVAEVLIGLGASTAVKDQHGRSCAHVVASTNDVSGAKCLRRLGATFECRDNGGRTPLMTAAWNRHAAIGVFLLETCGVDPNVADAQGATPLSIAAHVGDRDMVSLLLRLGAEPLLRDALGRTCVDVAEISGHAHIVALLKAATGSADSSSGFGSSAPNSPMALGKLASGSSSTASRRPIVVRSPHLQ